MTINVQIDAEHVNQVVANAVVNSVLGKELERSLEDVLKEITTTGWNRDSIIKRIVSEQIQKAIVQTLLTPEYHDRIKAIVHEYLTAKLTDDVLREALQAVFDSYFKR